MKEIEHLIVQAGGKGTRLGYLTEHKPKVLVSIFGLPLLYHFGHSFSKAVIYVIGENKYDVLEKYLKIYPPRFKHYLMRSSGNGTCQGLQKARETAMKNGAKHFAITWCDLHFSKEVEIPDMTRNYIGLTNEFTCRWSCIDGQFIEKSSNSSGIIGFFFFGNPEVLPEIPKSGEFVKFLKDAKVKLEPLFLHGVKEIGTKDSFMKIKEEQIYNRFFNSIVFSGMDVLKTTRDQNYKHLLADEINWYDFVSSKGYPNIPKIFGFDPLRMEKINGWHPYSYSKHEREMSKDEVIRGIILALKDLHKLGEVEYDDEETKEVYVTKTKQRIAKIAPIIPNTEIDFYKINGRRVKNLFNPKYLFEVDRIFEKIIRSDKFTVIHGDPTFSNTLIKNKSNRIIFIDPRGYFGKAKIFGDPLYDFAKVFYSAIGNYDQFNQRNFEIHINDNNIEFLMATNGFEDTLHIFREELGAGQIETIEILHSLIWLSLAGYVIDDVDSMLGAYFHGIELFNDVNKDD